MNDVQVFWPYNETFRYFHDVPLAGKRAQHFIDERNQNKEGRWILVPSEEYHKSHVGKELLKEEALFSNSSLDSILNSV